MPQIKSQVSKETHQWSVLVFQKFMETHISFQILGENSFIQFVQLLKALSIKAFPKELCF